MFGFSNKNNSPPKKPNIEPKDIKVKEHKSKEIQHTKFFQTHHNEKKSLLPKDTLTREELIKEIEKQFQKKGITDSNPFKTREDMYFLFYNNSMQLNRQPVPFEEIKIGGKTFYINKKFENGRIVIEDIYGSPDVEINLEEEYNKKETTKKQLEKLNKYILTIKNKIANGEDKYNLLDIEDLKEEKWRLEKILESIKYGKHATFIFQDPITNKKAYMMRYRNGEYNYLKVTENNFITEENNIKFLKGYEIQKRLEEIANLRIARNWREIFIGLFFLIIAILAIFSFFKLMTHDQVLFDQRVKNYCGESNDFLKLQMKNFAEFQCELQDSNLKDFQVAK